MKVSIKHSLIPNIFLCVMMSFSGLVYAQGKIGVVDLNGALAVADYSKQQLSALKNNSEFKDLAEKIKALKGDLQALQNEGEANALTWSQEQKQQQVKKMQGKVAELNGYGNQREKMKADLESRIGKELGPKIEKVVNQIIEEKGIGLLLNSQAVYFRTAEFDITNEVVDRVNKLK